MAAVAAGPQNWWAQSTSPRRRAAAYEQVRIRHAIVAEDEEGSDEDGLRPHPNPNPNPDPAHREADEEDVEEAYVAPRSPASGQEASVDATSPSRQPTTAPSPERDATPSAMQRLLQPLPALAAAAAALEESGVLSRFQRIYI